MTKSTFMSFHYDRDVWRVQKIRNMGVIEGQPIVSAQEWESVQKKGNAAVKKWIADQMKGKSAVVVLIGEKTATRPWVKYEITEAWNAKIPLIGIRIHGLADSAGSTDSPGANPFQKVKLTDGTTLASHIPIATPTGSDSKQVYKSISDNIDSWVSQAVKKK